MSAGQRWFLRLLGYETDGGRHVALTGPPPSAVVGPLAGAADGGGNPARHEPCAASVCTDAFDFGPAVERLVEAS